MSFLPSTATAARNQEGSEEEQEVDSSTVLRSAAGGVGARGLIDTSTLGDGENLTPNSRNFNNQEDAASSEALNKDGQRGTYVMKKSANLRLVDKLSYHAGRNQQQ